MPILLTAKNLLKTKGILTAKPNDSLSSVSLKLNSSHDAVFVVKKDQLLGIINPYHCLFSTRYPGSTKVANCLFSPPKVAENTELKNIARLMLESKVYYLPVYNQKSEWIGITSIRRLLQAILDNKEIQHNLPEIILSKNIVTIHHNKSISIAFNAMKKNHVSRLPVVNNLNKLIGIITHHDLRGVLTEPKNSQKRFSRVGNKSKKLDQPITGFMARNVIIAGENTRINEIITLMLDHKIGSIIITNTNNEAIDIISYKDILNALRLI